jgi:hypothetical protein
MALVGGVLRVYNGLPRGLVVDSVMYSGCMRPPTSIVYRCLFGSWEKSCCTIINEERGMTTHTRQVTK